MELTKTPEALRQEVSECKDELYAVVLAWADRGLTFTETTMILAGVAHHLLSMTEFKPSELLDLTSDTWVKK